MNSPNQTQHYEKAVIFAFIAATLTACDKNAPGTVQFGLDEDVSKKGTVDFESVRLFVQLENSQGEVQSLELDLYDFSGKTLSQPVSLNPGTYSINFTASLECYLFGINNGEASIDFLTTFYSEDWQHLVSVKDDSKIYLYNNNTLISEKPYTTDQLSSFAEFLIGAAHKTNESPDEFFHGYIDEIRIYNRPLNPYEIDELYK